MGFVRKWIVVVTYTRKLSRAKFGKGLNSLPMASNSRQCAAIPDLSNILSNSRLNLENVSETFQNHIIKSSIKDGNFDYL